METLLKVGVGIFIGAVGYGLLQPKQEVLEPAVSGSVVEKEEGNDLGEFLGVGPRVDEPASSVEIGETRGKKKAVSLDELNKNKNIGPSANPNGVVIGGNQPSSGAGATPQDFTQPNSENEVSEYLRDFPEEYHQLLDPPERRKDLPELHRDLMNEEQDLSWGPAIEQQITTFVMNHPYSNYLLDFRVTCKATLCEMMSKMDIEHTKKWDELAIEMAKEGWWEFTGTNSSGTYTKDKRYYVNVRILQRKKK
ncbi:hypothetical protein GCM10009123_16570 [Kangiella japonica]|uniref:Uncharacterized protein n=2 Tax=Kangiella japonica TaxID=647384 RepID=A0ABN0T214_9GAMM